MILLASTALAVPFNPTSDTRISGGETYDEVNIPPGVIVSFSKDTVLRAWGDIVISGEVYGAPDSTLFIESVYGSVDVLGGLVRGGDGAEGKPDNGSDYADAGDGGNGGEVYIKGRKLVRVSHSADVIGGHAGRGGEARAFNEKGEAFAFGGDGGDGGHVTLEATLGKVVIEGDVFAGHGGWAGAATSGVFVLGDDLPPLEWWQDPFYEKGEVEEYVPEGGYPLEQSLAATGTGGVGGDVTIMQASKYLSHAPIKLGAKVWGGDGGIPAIATAEGGLFSGAYSDRGGNGGHVFYGVQHLFPKPILGCKSFGNARAGDGGSGFSQGSSLARADGHDASNAIAEGGGDGGFVLAELVFCSEAAGGDTPRVEARLRGGKAVVGPSIPATGRDGAPYQEVSQ